MAKTSAIARQTKRERLVALYAPKRKALKEAGDYAALDKLPRNASPVRLHNRCKLTGSSERIYWEIRCLPKRFPPDGL
jgi:small subunit ribosomal protein S14